ncbi:cytokine-dependent hematopoietic cell linker [Dipodomys spectabilis]|uniref:cytokine-dependent hematopoietic cell linker n=1 Tax=Dipodomys spectabilis TaxID=105255 RepID=UPI001C54BF9C|nr:cytokine-dependent hematopoietic cell linker [Dipodomys spectabilis]
MPRTMNSPGNKRTTKEGSSDLKFQNFSLPKNRSWPRLSAAKGQCHSLKEPPAARSHPRPLPSANSSASCKQRNLAAVLSRAAYPIDDNYEDPELQLAEAWTTMKILPARPLKESEYADTRHFKAVMDDPLPSPPDQQGRSRQMKQELLKKRDSEIPLPPPRPPLTLPKKYQSLPTAPPETPVSALDNCTPCHTFPEAPRGPRQISLKDFSKVVGVDEDSHHLTRLVPSYPSQNTQKIAAAIASSSFMPNSCNMQDRDHKGSTRSCSMQRCPSPATDGPCENMLPHKNTSQREPVPTMLDAKELQHQEWYVGECSRQAVEEALMKESKDGTFLVRDCSTKSRAEPYVLVVFHGNKVYNVKIRFLEKDQKFALGTGLRGDKKFDSVEDMTEYYKYFPIVLIDGKDKTGRHREECYLTQPLPLGTHVAPR